MSGLSDFCCNKSYQAKRQEIKVAFVIADWVHTSTNVEIILNLETLVSCLYLFFYLFHFEGITLSLLSLSHTPLLVLQLACSSNVMLRLATQVNTAPDVKEREEGNNRATTILV